MQEKQRKQWELEYSKRVAAWYHSLKETLSTRHPLLKLLVEQQIRNRLVCVSQPEKRTELRMEVLRYLEVLDGTRAHSEQTELSPMDLRPWLLEADRIFLHSKPVRSSCSPCSIRSWVMPPAGKPASSAGMPSCKGRICAIRV